MGAACKLMQSLTLSLSKGEGVSERAALSAAENIAKLDAP
jgi:hypothetical protein